MLPLIPKSVKMTALTFDRIHKIAEQMGYSDNQLIVEAINAILNMVDQAVLDYVPKLIILARAAKEYDKCPQRWACAPTPSKRKKRKKNTSA